MSAESRQYVVGIEIAGFDTALTSRPGFPLSLFRWATKTEEAIGGNLMPQAFTADVKNRTLSAGGVTINTTHIPADWFNTKMTKETVVTWRVEQSDTTIKVKSTTSFPSAGRIYIGKECITYSGTTATSFTGCDRTNLNLKLGTYAHSHPIGLSVTDAPYTVVDKRCVVYWYDEKGKVVHKAARGWISDVSFSSSGFSFVVEGIGSRMHKKLIMSEGVGTGVVVGGFDNYVTDPTTIDGHNKILLTSKNIGNGGNYNAFVSGGDVVVYNHREKLELNVTVLETNVATGNRGAGFVVDWNSHLSAGMQIVFDDATSGEEVHTLVEFVGFSTTHPFTGKLVQISDGSFFPAKGKTVRTEDMYVVSGITRGLGGSKYHKIGGGDTFTEAIAKTGSYVALVLQLLLSGGGSSAKYNVLGQAGAGFSDDDIDWATIEQLPTFFTAVIVTKPTPPMDFLSHLAVLTGGYVNPLGLGGVTITAPDVYPGVDKKYVYKNDLVGAPDWSIEIGDIVNTTEIQGAKGTTYVNDADSIARFGGRTRTFEKIVNVPQLPTNLLAYRWLDNIESKDPRVKLSFVVLRNFLGDVGVGDILHITLPTVPQIYGGGLIHEEPFVITGMSGVSQTSVRLELISVKSREGIGYISPAGRVKSVSGNDITLELDEFCSSTLKPAPDISVHLNGEHDSYWFLLGDVIDIIDNSTVGSGSTTRTQVVITAIDYNNDKITCSSVPSWVAAGDTVILSDYTATSSGNLTSREPYFVRGGTLAGVVNKKYGV